MRRDEVTKTKFVGLWGYLAYLAPGLLVQKEPGRNSPVAKISL